MNQNLFVIVRSKSKIFAQCVKHGRSSLKFSATATQRKITTANKNLQVEILDENINYNHLNALLKNQKNETITQANYVKELKSGNAAKDVLEKEIDKLKQCKKAFETLRTESFPVERFDRDALLEGASNEFLFSPSNNMYEPVSGFYDYDANGCRILANILREWEKHFVNREQMLTIKCPSITSENVLNASGHVSRFTNFMIKDSGSAENFRLDHTIKHFLQKVISDSKISEYDRNEANMCLTTLEGRSLEELMAIIEKYQIKSPVSGKDLVNPVELNLMFPVAIGQAGMKGYLRPESSQGIFIKFQKLLSANHMKFPFACAQVATVFRNEISSGNGLLRLREFNIAEIEQFYYPFEMKCHKLKTVATTKLWLYSACDQMDDNYPQLMEIGDAVKMGLIKNEYLAYYMARTQTFLERIGVARNKIRFRQHIDTELAHYSCSCWDAECSTSFGWIECVSCADRGQFDLTQHATATGSPITVAKRLETPLSTISAILNKKQIGCKYKQKTDHVVDIINQLSDDDTRKLKEALDQNREYTIEEFTISPEMVNSFEEEEIAFEKVVPSVVEPSFGMDRIFYVLMEHTYRMRDNKYRTYFSLPPSIAPYKYAAMPLINRPEYHEIVDRITAELLELDVASAPSQNADLRIGKRYVELDGYGVPFAVTVDDDTIKDTQKSVTIRERDSTEQVLVPIEDVAMLVRRLGEGSLTWKQLSETYLKFTFKS